MRAPSAKAPQGGVPVLGAHGPGHGAGGHPAPLEELGHLLRVADVDAEGDGLAPGDVVQVGVDDQSVAAGDCDAALQVVTVVLNLVEAHPGQIDVGLDPHAADGHQLAAADGLLQRQPVGGVAEDLQDRPCRPGGPVWR